MAKKAKRTTSSTVKKRLNAAGYILPHGYEIKKKKRK